MNRVASLFPARPRRTRKVVDTNCLQSEVLRAYLSASADNYAVLTDYAAMEAYKSDTLKSIYCSMELLAQHPKQVIILKGSQDFRFCVAAKNTRHKCARDWFRMFCCLRNSFSKSIRAPRSGREGRRCGTRSFFAMRFAVTYRFSSGSRMAAREARSQKNYAMTLLTQILRRSPLFSTVC